ncbi:hypothetical protein PV327_007722 [Microctonus hyperodae]|uniref:Uncharacterized protein n=1 Tax=Microctonus hyperodae TaxID=165561 RepID=A0AA39G136_MICHY|nr:hypothetical protein PV327_007722 [Microctonus hyperodae]
MALLVNSINRSEAIEDVAIVTNSDDFPSSEKHTSKNSNGNIITLTLKNNHLIVETEERVTSMEDDPVVVEMQPIYAKDDINIHISSIDDANGGVSNQQALVHRAEILDDFPADFESSKLFGSVNTGLSQSDLSISSYGSVNHGYRYGNQVEYDAVQLGYSLHETNDYYGVPLSGKLEGSSKWMEFDKSPDVDNTALNNTMNINKNINDFKKPSNSLDSGSSLEHQDTTDTNSSPDTLRCNNNFQAINGATLINMKPMTPKGLINNYNKPECNKPVITGALLKDEVPELQKIQRLTKSNTFQEESTNLESGCLSVDQKIPEVRKPKFESSALVSTHKRNNSISPRFIEDIRDNEQKESIDTYNQIDSSTLTEFINERKQWLATVETDQLRYVHHGISE